MEYNKLLKELLNKADKIDVNYLINKHKLLFNQEGGSNKNKINRRNTKKHNIKKQSFKIRSKKQSKKRINN